MITQDVVVGSEVYIYFSDRWLDFAFCNGCQSTDYYTQHGSDSSVSL